MSRFLNLFVSMSLALAACGGLKEAPSGDDTGMPPVVTQPTGTNPGGNSGGSGSDCQADVDGDGLCEIDADGERGIDVLMGIDRGTYDNLAETFVAFAKEIVPFLNPCLVGYGTPGYENTWGTCILDAQWWGLDEGYDWALAQVSDNMDTYRVNMWNPEYWACSDPTHLDYPTSACWGILYGDGRIDPLVVRNDDGTYAVAFYVVDGQIWPGDNDGVGEESLHITLQPKLVCPFTEDGMDQLSDRARSACEFEQDTGEPGIASLVYFGDE